MPTPTKKSVRGTNKKHSVKEKDEGRSDDLASSFELNWSVSAIKIKKPYYFSQKHLEFYNHIKDPSTHMTMVDGSAGTAKTYIAVLAALELLREKTIKNIVYIRSVIESASRSIGALPGEVDDKFQPYAMPMLEKIREVSDETTASYLKNLGLCSAIPVNFVRGCTFNDSVVIVDEAQNLTRSELVTILTRFGKNTRYVVCGDLKQSDIGKASGYPDIYGRFTNDDAVNHGIQTFKFGDTEIVRSKILRYIVSVLEA